MFEFVGNIVGGGWDAVSNVVNTVGQGASSLVSGFFPSTQRAMPIVSDTAKAAGGSGMTYRPTPLENQSMVESFAYRAQNWIDTPYEGQFAVDVGTRIPQPTWGDNLADFFGKVKTPLQEYYTVKTLASNIAQDLGLVRRETITETPRAGYPAGQDVQHLNDIRQTGASVLSMIKGAGGAFMDQVKGLFNLGYPQNTAQPGFTLRHELEPSGKTTIGLAVAAAVIILVIFLGRKR